MSNISEPCADLRAENESLRRRVAALEAADRARRHAEDTLRQSEERYRILSELISDYAFETRHEPDQPTITEWLTGAFTAITGYERDELLAPDIWRRLAHPDDMPFIQRNWRQFTMAGKASVVEHRIITKQGEERWVRRYTRPIWNSEHNRLAGAYNAIQDITQRKQAEETLRQSEERYRVMSEMMSDFAYAIHIDSDGCRTPEWLTGAFTTITGFSREEFLSSEGWPRLTHPDDYPQVSDLWERCIQTGQSNVCDHRILTRDGAIRWARRYTRPVWDTVQGRVVRVYCAVQDITARKETEEALRQSRERYRVISEMMSDLTYALRYDADGKLVPEWVAGAFTGITGYDPDDFMSDTKWRDLTHPDDRTTVYETWLQSMQSGQDGVCEHRILTKQGEERWVRRYMRPIHNGDESTHVYGALQDITERKHAETTLRLREQFFQQVMEAIPDFVYVYDTTRRENVYTNRNILATLGYTPEQIEALGPAGYAALIHPDDQALLSSGIKRSLTELDDQEISFESRMRHADGTYHWFFSRHLTLISDAERKPQQVLGIVQDITARKRMEEALRQSEIKARALLDAPADTIYVFMMNRDGIILDANRAFASAMKKPVAELIGLYAYDMLPPDLAQVRKAYIDEAIRTKGMTRFEDMGVQQYYENIVSPILDEAGEVVQIAVFGRDITERKQMEEALRSAQERLVTLLQASPAVIYSAIPRDDFAITYVSPNAFDLVEYRPDEIISDPTFWEQHLHPDDANGAHTDLAAVITKGQSVAEYRFRHRNGSYRWIRDECRLVRDAEGQPEAIIGCCIDITERKLAEDALRASEARYRTLTKNFPSGMVFLFDHDLRYIIAEGKGLEVFGQTNDYFFGKTIWEIGLPEDVCAAVEQRYRAALAGETDLFETSIGALRYDVQVVPVIDSHGAIIAGMSVARDVTAQRQAEEAVRASEARLRALVDAIPDLLVRIRADGTFLDFKPPAEHERSVPQDAFVGRSIWDVFPRVQAEQMMMYVEKTLQTRELLLHEYRFDVDGMLQDREARYVSSGIDEALVIVRDITERKRQEERVRLLESVVVHSNDAVVITEAEMIDLPGPRIVYVNPAFERMTGYSEVEALGRTPRMLQGPNTDRASLQRIRRALQHWQPIRIELINYRKDTSEFWVELDISPVMDTNGLFTHWVAIQRDITERKQAETKLHATTSRLTALIENLQAGVLVEDESQHIALVNRMFCRQFGIPVSPQELIGTDCRVAAETAKELFPEPDLFLRRIDQILQARRLVTSEEIVLRDGRTFERDYIPISVESVYAGHLWQYRDITARKRVDRALRRYTERLQALYEIDQAILAEQSPQAIAQAALNHLRHLIPCPAASVALFDDTTRRVYLLAVRANGDKSIESTYSAPISKNSTHYEAMRRGEIIVVENLQALSLPAELAWEMQALNVNVVVCIPLRIQGELIGTLNLGATRADILTSDHQTIVGEVATSLAIAIRQARLYEQTVYDAHLKANLLREVNHRVKNNLSAIVGLLFAEQRRADMNKQSLYQSIITDLASRVQSLARVHDLLSASEWSPVQLNELIRQISQLALKALPTQPSLPLIVNDSPILVTPDQAHNLALIINELATNSVKYAFPVVGDSLCLTARITGDNTTIRLEFSDNGPGYPLELLQSGRPHFHVGFELIHNLVQRSLRGTMKILNHNGAVTIIEFPLIPVTKPGIDHRNLRLLK